MFLLLCCAVLLTLSGFACSGRHSKPAEPTFADSYEECSGTAPDLTLICEITLEGIVDLRRHIVDLRRTTRSKPAPVTHYEGLHTASVSPHDPEREFGHVVSSMLVRDGIEITVKARWSHWPPDNNSGSIEERIVVPAHTDLTIVRGKLKLEAKWYPPHPGA